MRKSIKNGLLFLLFLLVALPVVSQNYYFKKHQVEDGLSYNSTTSILQDSYGFMWFGSEDGLNRYDGAKFTIFKTDAEDSTSIGNNHIYSLYEGKDRSLWVGTSKGLYIYKRDTDIFIPFNKTTKYDVTISSTVTRIIETQKGQFWITTLGQGLFIYDKEKDLLTQNSTYTSFAWDIAEDQRHRVYISSMQEGLVCFDQNGKYIETHTLDNPSINGDMRIYCIFPKENSVWYSMGTNNIVRLNTTTNTLEQFSNTEQNMGAVKSITSFSEQELLIASDYGLYLFNYTSNKFTRIDNPLDARSLSDQSVNYLYKDREGGFWISTDLGGINYLSQQTRVFDYHHPSYDIGLGTGRIINQFAQDEEGNIWIGTQNGLKKMDVKGKISPFTIPGNNKNYDIRSLFLDGNKLWIGTLGYGLMSLDLTTNRLKEYKASRTTPRSIKSNDILSIYKCVNGDIYVGTSWGLCKYAEQTDDFDSLTNISTMVTISDMLEDEVHTLWVATHNSGVYRYDTNSNRLQHYIHYKDRENTIISNAILCMFSDENGRIWLGSNGNGLCYYDKESDSFEIHKESSKILKDRIIYSIEQDNLGRLWTATSAGLACIDIEGHTPTKLYTKENGVQSNQFTLNASHRNSVGKLFFGGINGFNSFYPDELKSNNYAPPTYITKIRLHSKDGKESYLQNFTHLSNEIELSYTNNSFTIEYAALSYEEPNKNDYSYKLEGFDDRWISNQNLSSTSYTNLPPGKYVFKVIGSNNDGLNDKEGTALTITIVPPWWKSNIATIIYVTLILSLLLLTVRYLNNRAQQLAKREIASFEKEKEKELYQSKISFFINLVHEIRTPLSLIKLPLDHLNEQKEVRENKKVMKYIDIIDKNVNYLLNIINQLLDFQKTENKTPKLEYKIVDMNEAMVELHNKFLNYAELKNIELLLVIPEESRMVNVDQSAIDKITFNLIDNAIRYAKSKVEISLACNEDSFTISVIDDGVGIADDEKEKVFEAFYQVDDKINGGTGIGLAFSMLLTKAHNGTLLVKDSKWRGSHFELTLPYQSEYKQIENTKEIPIERSAERETTIEKSFSENTILLVEDNVELLQLTKEFLSESFKVLTASNGEEALKVLENEEIDIDIVISDIMMPVMDGLELCKAIKSELNYSHIPVILLTAKVTSDAKVEGMEYGADVYIEKPFAMRQIQIQIENLLKLRTAFQKQINSQSTLTIDSPSLSKKDQEFLERLELEIEQHINESDFYIDSIAETMFMSRSSFYRKIKSITGVSPSEFLKTLRLNKAAEMLAEGTYNIGEVYVYVGFSSSSYFAKCFKTQFGILPKDYVAKGNSYL